ncbi:hypothetical protein Patl1_31376 [Pistacia atlantica]|uniref:Uncharacterized protein n=1 Tax=Pistacia atlantica TaxID=434234 RepID=A0ACC1AQS9_9ROSI|nr:hypothetical protein Patl1_31376 [Pistacia atlantica]
MDQKLTKSSINQHTRWCYTTTTANPEYLTWKSQDQTLLKWLCSTLTPTILSIVKDCTTSYDLWVALAEVFFIMGYDLSIQDGAD